MPNSKSSTDVIRAQAVAVQLMPGNVQPPVSQVRISLAENQLPIVHLLVDPAHKRNAPPTPAMAPTLVDIKQWLDKVQTLAADPDARASLVIELVDGTGATAQYLRLNNWLITAAGMSGVSATGQIGLEVELQHPVGLLDRTPANIGNVLEQPMNWKSGLYKDVLDGVSKSYVTWASLTRTAPSAIPDACAGGTGAATPASVIRKVKEALVAQAQSISTYLKWSPAWPENSPGYTGFPFIATCLSGHSLAVKHSLTAYASQPGDSSIWSMFVGVISPEWQLTTVPTYWDTQLQVMPFSPWAKPAISIDATEITTISFPGVDPAVVGGVRMPLSPAEESTDYNFRGAVADRETQQQASEAVYLPPLALKKGPTGRVLTFRPPSWLDSTLRAQAAADGAQTQPGVHESKYSALTTSENITPDAAAPAGGGTEGLDTAAAGAGALYGVAKQAFMAHYRAGVDASVLTPLRIQCKGSKWPQNYVTPGCVVEVKSGDAVLFLMYLVTVEHVLDVANATATTVWTGRYCRPEGGLSDIITSPQYNPMYMPK